jgi:hypothetical protein
MSDESHFYVMGIPRSVFLLWVYLGGGGKGKGVCRNRPYTIQELKRPVGDRIATISQ